MEQEPSVLSARGNPFRRTDVVKVPLRNQEEERRAVLQRRCPDHVPFTICRKEMDGSGIIDPPALLATTDPSDGLPSLQNNVYGVDNLRETQKSPLLVRRGLQSVAQP